jgi:hypothetical protein
MDYLTFTWMGADETKGGNAEKERREPEWESNQMVCEWMKSKTDEQPLQPRIVDRWIVNRRYGYYVRWIKTHEVDSRKSRALNLSKFNRKSKIIQLNT